MTHMSNLYMVGKHDESDDTIITTVVLLHRKCDAGICTKKKRLFIKKEMHFIKE